MNSMIGNGAREDKAAGGQILEHSRAGRAACQAPGAALYATVGLMHDMVEDSDVTEDELRAAGVTEEEMAAVRLLTRGPEPYEAYVGLVAASGNRLAISVKLCDLLDHLDPAFNAGLTLPNKPVTWRHCRSCSTPSATHRRNPRSRKPSLLRLLRTHHLARPAIPANGP